MLHLGTLLLFISTLNFSKLMGTGGQLKEKEKSVTVMYFHVSGISLGVRKKFEYFLFFSFKLLLLLFLLK